MADLEPVTIIGATGALGLGLAMRWARAGVPIVLGSRVAERAEESAIIARELVPQGSFTGLANDEAATQAQTVVLCVPFASQAQTLNGLKGSLREGQILVDATVPLAVAVGGKPTRMLGVWEGSAAEQAQSLVPAGVRVVSALHTVSAAALRELDHPLDEDVLVCGKKADKTPVMELIDRIEGLRSVDCGTLDNSRTTESLTALLIGVNGRYKTHAGLKITGL